MEKRRNEEIRQEVRKTYGKIASGGTAGCGCAPSSCCGPEVNPKPEDISTDLGYSPDDVSTAPEGANMGLGCGNPQAIASLRPGETVLDLGSGGGFDCFLAARAVGQGGHVIGVDMTPEMVYRSREIAEKGGFGNVEFRLGEIEHLPIADNSVDVIISNCVINLSPEKGKVFREAYRILKKGGRLAVSDVVATGPLPDQVKKDLALYAGCVSGAEQIDELESLLREAGFTNIRIRPLDKSQEVIRSSSIEAMRP